MDTTKTNGTAQSKNRAGTRKNLLKFMFFLFILHAIVTFLSHGTGVVETFRSFLIHVFWPPEGWAGETLPVHQQLVHATLTALWSLPFWKVFWWLCGFPMLPLMAAVLNEAVMLSRPTAIAIPLLRAVSLPLSPVSARNLTQSVGCLS